MQRKQTAGKLHVALIMDGNGRWAQLRNLPRQAGHQAGVETVCEVVKAAPELGISTLTLYAFSSDNWKRPAGEISHLMGLLRDYLAAELPLLLDNDVRLTVIGRRDRLPEDLVASIAFAEAVTRGGERLNLRIALDYSSREQILAAAAAHKDAEALSVESLSRYLSSTGEVDDVDLLIRTSGEQRLSDFLLWECAYSEFYFTDCLWPDFSPVELEKALNVFRSRSRRFGGLDKPADEVCGKEDEASHPLILMTGDVGLL